mgnify:CR=1 FL=1
MNGAWSRSLRDFLTDAAEWHHRSGWERYWLPATSEVLGKLAHQADCHAVPELASSIEVRCEGEKLVEWYNLPDGPISVADNVSEDRLREFARSVGGDSAMKKGI